MVSRENSRDEAVRFRELISAELYARLWRQATWLTRCHEDAEDLLQETLTAAFQQLKQLRDLELLVPWLLRIMRRRFLNMERCRQRREQREERVRRDVNPEPAGAAAVEEELARAALLRLKPEERWLLTMHYIEGYSHAELTAALEFSEAAVRQRLSRARRALKRELELLQVEDTKRRP